jgi:chloramphenicol O-acetyltransferase type A
MRVEVDPKKTSRALAYELWMQAPNPMVTFFKTMDVTELIRISRKRKLKFNMLMDYCIGKVAETCVDRDLSSDSMVIGTSAIIDTEIDGAVGMNSGIFNNPFMIWGKYRKKLFRYYLPVSFQFHHTQMDGAHAGRFLDNLQKEINDLRSIR